MSNVWIEMKDVSKSFFNNHVIKQMSITIEKNKTYLLKGENGSGKSTFLKLIIDLYKPNHGLINRYYKDLRYVPEMIKIKSDITVQNYIIHALALKNLNRDTALESLLELDLKKPLKHLSKGNQKKVLLYLAMVGEPEILCLDEPLDGLDVTMQKKVLTYLKDLNKTYIISTHAMRRFNKFEPKEVILFEVD